MSVKPKRVRSLEDLPIAALLCHLSGHRWDPAILPDRQFSDGTVYGRIENRCSCGTVRTDNVDSSGALWGRSYNYVDYYPFSASKEEYRVEWLRRERARLQRREEINAKRRNSRRQLVE